MTGLYSIIITFNTLPGYGHLAAVQVVLLVHHVQSGCDIWQRQQTDRNRRHQP